MTYMIRRVEFQISKWNNGHTYVGYRTQSERAEVETYCRKKGYTTEYYLDVGNGMEHPARDYIHIIYDERQYKQTLIDQEEFNKQQRRQPAGCLV